MRERAVHGYLDHTGTAVLTGSGLPATDAAAAAARLEVLAEDLRAAGYPATIGQARADLYLRLLDGTLDGLTRAQILTTMLRLGPIAPADGDLDAKPSQQRNRDQRTVNPQSMTCPSNPCQPSELTSQSAPSNPVRAVPVRLGRLTR